MTALLRVEERLAAEATLAFLRYALDSLERAEHFAATARLPDVYMNLRSARQPLNSAIERLLALKGEAVPLALRTFAHGQAFSVPARRRRKAGRS